MGVRAHAEAEVVHTINQVLQHASRKRVRNCQHTEMNKHTALT